MLYLTEKQYRFPPGGTVSHSDAGNTARSTTCFGLTIQSACKFSSFKVEDEDGNVTQEVTSRGLDTVTQNQGDFIFPGIGKAIVEYAFDTNGGAVQEHHP